MKLMKTRGSLIDSTVLGYLCSAGTYFRTTEKRRQVKGIVLLTVKVEPDDSCPHSIKVFVYCQLETVICRLLTIYTSLVYTEHNYPVSAGSV